MAESALENQTAETPPMSEANTGPAGDDDTQRICLDGRLDLRRAQVMALLVQTCILRSEALTQGPCLLVHDISCVFPADDQAQQGRASGERPGTGGKGGRRGGSGAGSPELSLSYEGSEMDDANQDGADSQPTPSTVSDCLIGLNQPASPNLRFHTAMHATSLVLL